MKITQQHDTDRLVPLDVELRRLRAENGRLRESNDQLRGEVAELRELIEELDPSGQGRYCWLLYGSATA
jgi:hypothetical protein